MPYWDTSELAEDTDFRARCTAALATEQHPAPEQQSHAWRWQYAGTPGFGEDYAYAVATGVQNPGRVEEVISDADIHARTQQLMGVSQEAVVRAQMRWDVERPNGPGVRERLAGT